MINLKKHVYLFKRVFALNKTVRYYIGQAIIPDIKIFVVQILSIVIYMVAITNTHLYSVKHVSK